MDVAWHIKELRNVVLYCLSWFGLIFSVCYYFNNDLILISSNYLLNSGLSGYRFALFGLVSGFLIRMKLASYFALIFCIPIFALHLYKYISLGLFKRERKIVLVGILVSYALLILGLWICGVYFMPLFLHFFFQMNHLPNVIKVLDASLVLSSVGGIFFAFGLMFQTPIAIFFLLYFGLITPSNLGLFRKISLVAFVTIGGVITPPDVVSQIIASACMLCLSEAGILFYKLYRFFNANPVSSHPEP
jgi:sec-independent protein translocase protein TatC